MQARWISIKVMAKKFLELKTSVKQAMIHSNKLNKWNEDNLLLLQLIISILQPALGRQNSSLLTAEAIIDVLLKTIPSTPTNDNPAIRNFETLKARLEE